MFTLIDLVNELGIGAFTGGHVSQATFRLAELFRPADPAGTAVALRHAAYQELLAAEYLRQPASRDTVLATIPRPRLTEETRASLYRRSHPAAPAASGDCVVPAGTYLVGPGHHLMLRRLDHPVRFDRYPVTVARYKQFLRAFAAGDPARWDHPGTPAGHTHQPRPGQLPVPGYYHDPAYDQHPAVAITWWSAWAFARSQSKRLPTALEWEAAARGPDGRLFPWGDDIDYTAVNCADTWSGHPLITYTAWRAERDHGKLRHALPGPVDAHPANTSPFGIRELAGNTWKWTATTISGHAVVCGGSFDNPYRAIQASTKGTTPRDHAATVTSFRCAQNLP